MKSVFKKTVYKERALCFETKMNGEIKLNSEHLLELATLETNAIWRT